MSTSKYLREKSRTASSQAEGEKSSLLAKRRSDFRGERISAALQRGVYIN